MNSELKQVYIMRVYIHTYVSDEMAHSFLTLEAGVGFKGDSNSKEKIISYWEFKNICNFVLKTFHWLKIKCAESGLVGAQAAPCLIYE